MSWAEENLPTGLWLDDMEPDEFGADSHFEILIIRCVRNFSKFDNNHLQNLIRKYKREGVKDHRFYAACAVFASRSLESGDE